jgi:hypothetical protein
MFTTCCSAPASATLDAAAVVADVKQWCVENCVDPCRESKADLQSWLGRVVTSFKAAFFEERTFAIDRERRHYQLLSQHLAADAMRYQRPML